MSETDGGSFTASSYTASTRGFPQPRLIKRDEREAAKRRETLTRARPRPRTAPPRPRAGKSWDKRTACRPLHVTCVEAEQEKTLRKPRAALTAGSGGGSAASVASTAASVASTVASSVTRLQSARPVRPRSAPPAAFRARAAHFDISRRNGLVDAEPGALPSRRAALAAFRPTTGGVVYARRTPLRPAVPGTPRSAGGVCTTATRRLRRRRRGWNQATAVRGDEARRQYHPGLTDGGYHVRIVKHAPARRTSVDEIVFGLDLDGDGCCDDLMAAGVGICAAGRNFLAP